MKEPIPTIAKMNRALTRFRWNGRSRWCGRPRWYDRPRWNGRPRWYGPRTVTDAGTSARSKHPIEIVSSTNIHGCFPEVVTAAAAGGRNADAAFTG
jgi:hypothetical protein